MNCTAQWQFAWSSSIIDSVAIKQIINKTHAAYVIPYKTRNRVDWEKSGLGYELAVEVCWLIASTEYFGLSGKRPLDWIMIISVSMGFFPKLGKSKKNMPPCMKWKRETGRIIKDEPNYILTDIFSHRVFEALQRVLKDLLFTAAKLENCVIIVHYSRDAKYCFRERSCCVFIKKKSAKINLQLVSAELNRKRFIPQSQAACGGR